MVSSLKCCNSLYVGSKTALYISSMQRMYTGIVKAKDVLVGVPAFFPEEARTSFCSMVDALETSIHPLPPGKSMMLQHEVKLLDYIIIWVVPELDTLVFPQHTPILVSIHEAPKRDPHFRKYPY